MEYIIVDVISLKAIEELEALPTIDPIATIDEEILVQRNNNANIDTYRTLYVVKILQELKFRLSLTQK